MKSVDSTADSVTEYSSPATGTIASVLKSLLLSVERLTVAVEKDLGRIANHFDPPASDIVGTPYVSKKLGCTTVWITELIRLRKIPPNCIVQGTGNGKPWKFYRNRVDAWIEER